MNKLKRIPLYVILLIFGVTTLFPFMYMIATAFTPDTYTMPYPPILFPKSFYLGNFINAIKSNNFGRYFLNSAFVSILSTIFALIVSSLTAYGFARFNFKGKEIIFKIFLFTMMVPGLLNIVPQFLVIKSMKLVDTYTGLILLYIGGGIAGNTFFLRGFFESIPIELEESVIIDGGSRWTIFTKIILPLSKPALGTFSIFAFTGFWDEFYGALTLIKTPSKRTLPIALQLFRGQHASDWGLIFAASLIAIVPVILIFIIFQKKFVKSGALNGSIKG
ncbi:carbohydrate ABC transporter permease [Caloranaerobacter ferrireducens]|uniref:carbohydrate ABC transporter permease n=1 Tax=Caloranaerobacter ferrireducens TaxID=1323370 RepID=UPI00084D42C4|nr:carbohydrate ABC transporter permease [Caloranaerobacter ferrireducens]